ncbi:maleylpyruvate isomerase family mycothiol-dependent enzyme [Streptomyces sp. G45]|uniref:maleylpyruvate isomerase family mycothiol-dependent enzyme n=1 Tax=Streptomyces sp. G45 TaxID=3406627 RepID=UPI003C1D14E4
MTQPQTGRLASALLHTTTAFADLVDGADWDAHVPTCPEWPLRVLVGHLGQAPRWMAAIVRGGAPDGVPDPRDETPPRDWRAWLHAGAVELAVAVREVGADTPVWTLTGPGPASFWLRQATHDATVHTVDAALLTKAPYAIEPDLAADAVTQLLELLSAPAATTLKPALAALHGTGTLTLRPTEPALPAWTITRTPTGVTWHPGTADADVTVTAPAQDLLLILTRRLPTHHAKTEGDETLFAHWLTHSAL